MLMSSTMERHPQQQQTNSKVSKKKRKGNSKQQQSGAKQSPTYGRDENQETKTPDAKHSLQQQNNTLMSSTAERHPQQQQANAKVSKKKRQENDKQQQNGAKQSPNCGKQSKKKRQTKTKKQLREDALVTPHENHAPRQHNGTKVSKKKPESNARNSNISTQANSSVKTNAPNTTLRTKEKKANEKIADNKPCTENPNQLRREHRRGTEVFSYTTISHGWYIPVLGFRLVFAPRKPESVVRPCDRPCRLPPLKLGRNKDYRSLSSWPNLMDGYAARKLKNAGTQKAFRWENNIARITRKKCPRTKVTQHAEERFRQRGKLTHPIYAAGDKIKLADGGYRKERVVVTYIPLEKSLAVAKAFQQFEQERIHTHNIANRYHLPRTCVQMLSTKQSFEIRKFCTKAKKAAHSKLLKRRKRQRIKAYERMGCREDDYRFFRRPQVPSRERQKPLKKNGLQHAKQNTKRKGAKKKQKGCKSKPKQPKEGRPNTNNKPSKGEKNANKPTERIANSNKETKETN